MSAIKPRAQRRIIDRPRLTRLLDETHASVIVLVAPAGYGKTTLAEQWLKGRRHGWLKATSSLTDVAALALGLAEAAEIVIDGIAVQISRCLNRFADPASKTGPLAACLASAVSDWPEDAWLAIDDYHLAASAPTDDMLDRLLTAPGIKLLVTARERPSWATARRLLYGEIYEVGQARLAMTEEEAEEVLGQRSDTSAQGLVALADGWPAVIGLAAIAGPMAPTREALPETLYRYFADELLQKADAEVRAALAVLAITPSITRGVVRTLASNETSATRLIDGGLRQGLLIERTDGSLEMNPLLRAFLQRELAESDRPRRTATIRRIFDHYVKLNNWDDAYALAETAELPELIIPLVEESMDDVLAAGRIASLATWSEFARTSRLHAPALDLADAEIAFRRGLHGRSEALAGEAARCFEERHPLYARARLRGGQAAYFNDRHRQALESFAEARKASRSPTIAREALWGSFITAIDLELDDAAGFLKEYEQLPDQTIDDVVRLVTGRLSYGHRREGLVAVIEQARAAAHLAERARQPMIRTAFWKSYGSALSFSAEYEAAIVAADRGATEAEANGLDFVLPHARLVLAQAHLGIRENLKARRLVDEMEADARQRDDEFFLVNGRTLQARLHLARGRPVDALPLTDAVEARTPSPSTKGERLAVRSLALMMIGETTRAVASVADARRATTTGPTLALTGIVRAICSHDENAVDRAIRAVAESGHFDMLVLAYRSRSELLTNMRRVMGAEAMSRLLLAAHDDAVALRLGIVSQPPERLATTTLSPREREVGGLLAEGRTNAEIAAALFISEVTAKVHVRHILTKLGVRNRSEAAVLISEQLRQGL